MARSAPRPHPTPILRRGLGSVKNGIGSDPPRPGLRCRPMSARRKHGPPAGWRGTITAPATPGLRQNATMGQASEDARWDVWGPLRDRYWRRAAAGGPHRVLALDGGGIRGLITLPSWSAWSRCCDERSAAATTSACATSSIASAAPAPAPSSPPGWPAACRRASCWSSTGASARRCSGSAPSSSAGRPSTTTGRSSGSSGSSSGIRRTSSPSTSAAFSWW